jgi:antitoxin component YwqK of YwqJK toxin-antitoxin module
MSKAAQKDNLVCIQIVDRNGLNETISSKDRLEKFQTTDFLSSQPYQHVVRIYENSSEKKFSKITSYHSNGLISQYLDVVNARAFGQYKQWHQNGILAIEAKVIGGPAGISPLDQQQWIFDETCKAWDEKGHLISIFTYEKGNLEGTGEYFHENGNIKKKVPYSKNEIDGMVYEYAPNNDLSAKQEFKKGKRDGISEGYWGKNKNSYVETFENDLLIEGKYFDVNGKLIEEIHKGNGIKAVFNDTSVEKLIEYQFGKPEGKVQVFENNSLYKVFYIKNDQKNGEETEFFLSTDSKTPKISINWVEDKVQGTVKTWYLNGQLQTQKEMYQNKKNGLATAWYKNGSIMFIEEYENDLLVKGSYYKKDEKIPISTILNGNGTANLFDEDGNFLKSIKYIKSIPEVE